MEKLHTKPQLIELVNKTPPTRDRYIDFLRAYSIIVVILGHWLSAVVIRDGDGVRVYNAVGMIPHLWISTWLLQVMPLFFFVGGFSNSRTINSLKNRGIGLKEFYKRRAIRLLKPTLIFCLVWVLAILIMIAFLPDWQRYSRAVIATIGPLWFLGVYLFITVVSPFMLKLHQRSRYAIPLMLLVLTAFVDILRFRYRITWIAWFNVAFVWLFVHQLGFFYEDNALVNIQMVKKVFIVLSGLFGLIIFTNLGPYPRSMVGTGFEKISNMNPPTICISMLSLWLIGIALILRRILSKCLEGARMWLLVILANRTIMTIYLWHLTAYALAYLLLYQFGLGHHNIDNITIWWLERPVWIIIPGIILFGFIKFFGRYETAP